jgi:hypothetical protein
MGNPPSDLFAGADEQSAQGEDGQHGGDENDVEHHGSPVEIPALESLHPVRISVPYGRV